MAASLTGLHHLTFSFGLAVDRQKVTTEIEQVVKAQGLDVRGITFYSTEHCAYADVEPVDDWALYERALDK
jgi:hypothetical protein